MDHLSRVLNGNQNLPALTDKFGRILNYLRLAVTERCNLRCTYCMPESGIVLKPEDQILAYEEMLRLVKLVIRMGVTKVRVTGGEPMIRKGITEFIRRLSSVSGLNEVHLTTNGFWGRQQIDELDSLNLAGVNFSLDTLNPERFKDITRRDAFDAVWATFMSLLEKSIPLKINAVIQRGVNEDEIIALSKLAQKYSLDVRFIEEMPFNGGVTDVNPFSAGEIQAILKAAYPAMQKTSPPGSVSSNYTIAGFKGQLGIIAGFSRTFCSSCNRLRVTSTGQVKTCLYGKNELDLRALLRDGSSDEFIAQAISQAVNHKARDGFEAEKMAASPVHSSMSTIGG